MKVSHSNATKPAGVASSLSALSVYILFFKLVMCRNTRRHYPDCTFTDVVYLIVNRKLRVCIFFFFPFPPSLFFCLVCFGFGFCFCLRAFASVSILDAVFLSWFFRRLGWWMSLLPEFIQMVFGLSAKARGKEK